MNAPTTYRRGLWMAATETKCDTSRGRAKDEAELQSGDKSFDEMLRWRLYPRPVDAALRLWATGVFRQGPTTLVSGRWREQERRLVYTALQSHFWSFLETGLLRNSVSSPTTP
jgi:hypothetical protein